jgi:FKBP-type peptidyl-prolyl cis-trans isomerase (trigger factor)
MAVPMTISVNPSGPCQHRLRVSLSAEAVHPIRDVVVREFQQGATLAGFRKGKAPRELVERKYPEAIRDETLRRLTRQIFEQATDERKLRPVGPFEVTRLNFDEAKGLELEAQVEVEPAFQLAPYRGIRLSQPGITISAEEIGQALRALQESMAELVPAGEGKPKEKRVPNLDDEFAKDVGFDNLDQLHTHLEARLRERKRSEQAQALEQSLCDELLARHAFEVPPRLVARQTERLTKDFQARLLLAGFSDEQVKDELAKYTEQLRTSASRHVKLAFVLERIAEAEGVSVTQDEVVDRLWKLAKRWEKDPAEVRRLLDAQGLWPSVLSSLRQEKTIKFLLSVAQIEEVEPLNH